MLGLPVRPQRESALLDRLKPQFQSARFVFGRLKLAPLVGEQRLLHSLSTTWTYRLRSVSPARCEWCTFRLLCQPFSAVPELPTHRSIV